MIVVMAAGSRLTRCRALKCLNMAPSLSAGALRAERVVAGLLVRCRGGVLRGGQHAFVPACLPLSGASNLLAGHVCCPLTPKS